MIDQLLEIARAAGEETLKFYQGEHNVQLKEDQSPLTLADQASHELIVSRLARLFPNDPIISEESKQTPPDVLMSYQRFWLVDPLDGTKEFLKKTGDFTINIALIENRRPTVGVIYIPVEKTFYFAARETGSFKQQADGPRTKIKTRRANEASLGVVASKDHAGPQVAAMLEKLPGASLSSRGSSLKFCLVAEGLADIYPRFVPTMEWDTAAADCILECAGGAVLTLDGTPLPYQKPGLKNEAIISIGDTQLQWKKFLP